MLGSQRCDGSRVGALQPAACHLQSIGLCESHLKHWAGIAVYHIHLPATPLNGRLQCMPLHALHVTVVTCKAAALSCRGC